MSVRSEGFGSLSILKPPSSLNIKQPDSAADIGDAKLKLPRVNVHAFKYGKGRQTLEMIGEGSFV
jgi:hypothetical protein